MLNEINMFRSKSEATLYALILFLGSLQAVSVLGIPCSWISQSTVIPFAFLVIYFLRDSVDLFPIKLIAILTVWLLITTAIGCYEQSFVALWPKDSTVPYELFVGLRFFSIITFALFLYALIVLLNHGLSDKIITIAMLVGVFASLYALYSYYAQVHGLPELIRNRDSAYGAHGEKIIFSYAFHRALGSFLEPSTLAAFLIVPFFCSVSSSNRQMGNVAACIILATIFLTGSLAGILSIVIGTFLASLLLVVGKKAYVHFLRIFFRLSAIAVFSFLIFKVVVHPNAVNTSFEAPAPVPGQAQVENASGIGFLITRIDRMMSSGMTSTDRGYVYKALMESPPPLIGVGLGVAYLELGRTLGENKVVNFLNLYLNMLYSGGIIALLGLIVFLLFPIIRALMNLGNTDNQSFFYFMSAYLAWLVIYFGLYDEFNLMSAIPYSVLIYLSSYKGKFKNEVQS